MFVHELPQLCVHLIGSFIQDEIDKQKKTVRAKYMINRTIELTREIHNYLKDINLTKEELAIVGTAFQWGKEHHYNERVFKSMKSNALLYYKSAIAIKNGCKQRRDYIKQSGHIQRVFNVTYKDYSECEFIKSLRIPVPKPKRTPITLYHKGKPVKAVLVE